MAEKPQPETEELFTAKEVASELGLAGAMLRRYAATYEEVADDEIDVHRRDGRLFTLEQLATLKKARALVSNQGLSVRSALEVALGKNSSVPLVSAERRSEGLQEFGMIIDALAQNQAFSEMLTKAVSDGSKELLEEMRKLNENLSRVSISAQDASDLKNSNIEHNFKSQALEASRPHGVFVRFALWVEKFLGRQ